MNYKFNHGDMVKCIITGFAGVVTGRSDYFNGCVNYCVKPKLDKEGKPQEAVWLDEPQLKLVKAEVATPIHETASPVRRVGGPGHEAPIRG